MRSFQRHIVTVLFLLGFVSLQAQTPEQQHMLDVMKAVDKVIDELDVEALPDWDKLRSAYPNSIFSVSMLWVKFEETAWTRQTSGSIEVPVDMMVHAKIIQADPDGCLSRTFEDNVHLRLKFIYNTSTKDLKYDSMIEDENAYIGVPGALLATDCYNNCKQEQSIRIEANIGAALPFTPNYESLIPNSDVVGGLSSSSGLQPSVYIGARYNLPIESFKNTPAGLYAAAGLRYAAWKHELNANYQREESHTDLFGNEAILQTTADNVTETFSATMLMIPLKIGIQYPLILDESHKCGKTINYQTAKLMAIGEIGIAPTLILGSSLEGNGTFSYQGTYSYLFSGQDAGHTLINDRSYEDMEGDFNALSYLGYSNNNDLALESDLTDEVDSGFGLFAVANLGLEYYLNHQLALSFKVGGTFGLGDMRNDYSDESSFSNGEFTWSALPEDNVEPRMNSAFRNMDKLPFSAFNIQIGVSYGIEGK